MSFKQLQETYIQEKSIQELSKGLEKPAARCHLTGLLGSAKSFVGASVFAQTDFNHVFVLNDAEEAAYFQNDLRNLITGESGIFFFQIRLKRAVIFTRLTRVMFSLEQRL